MFLDDFFCKICVIRVICERLSLWCIVMSKINFREFPELPERVILPQGFGGLPLGV